MGGKDLYLSFYANILGCFDSISNLFELSAHDLTVHVYYEDIYNVLVFLIAAFVAGRFTEALGTPALVGEIITGFLVSAPSYNCGLTIYSTRFSLVLHSWVLPLPTSFHIHRLSS